MSYLSRGSEARFRPAFEALEDRCLLAVASFANEPIVPTIDYFTKAHLRAVYAQGLQLGNRPAVFANAGDSNSVLPYFLDALGAPSYNATNPAIVGPYAYLADTVQYFRATPADGTGANSFTRSTRAAGSGWTSTNLVSGPLLSELAAIRPSFVLVMIGTNEVLLPTSVEEFRYRLTTIAGQALSQGVIPVLSTIPDFLYGVLNNSARATEFNQVIAEVADSLDIPLWNFWRALQPLPNRGLEPAGVHLSAYPGGSGVFNEQGLQFGFNVRNLTALQVLDKLRRVIVDNGPSDGDPTPETVSFVDKLYTTLLGRPADEAGRTFWSAALESRLPRTAVAQALWHSAEHRAMQVDAYFREYLHRTPDQASRTFWVNVFLAGASELEVEYALLTSREYTSSHASDADFITSLYTDLLGREPEVSEQEDSEERLSQGETRVDLVRRLLTSQSGYRRSVQDLYSDILGREADPSSESISVGLLEARKLNIEWLGVTLLASEEFRLRTVT